MEIFILSILFAFLCFGNVHVLYATKFESLPAILMDYKVKVDPGREDCYYQLVHPGATIYISFQVLRGGNGVAGFMVRHPNGEIVHPYELVSHTEYQDVSAAGGYYTFCVDNRFSRFADKLVNLYVTVIKYEQWEQFNKEIEELNLSVTNFTTAISNVEHQINNILQLQHHSRSREARDYNLLIDNNVYVFRWSFLQVICIVATSLFQIYFVRHMFEVKNVKPRA